MEIKWTEDDIVCGRIVCKPTEKGQFFRPTGWTAKWTYKIGFIASSTLSEDKRCGCVLISMADGMVSSCYSKAQLADRLNSDGLIPMPHAWLIETMDYLRDCYEQPKSYEIKSNKSLSC